MLCLACTVSLLANDYEEAWKALNRNDRKTAVAYLQKAFNDPATSVDAYITYMYLSTFEGNDAQLKDFTPRVYDKLSDPNPYVYALWFNDAVAGYYGKKKPAQQALLNKILNDGKCNGSLQSAAHYSLGWSLQASADFDHKGDEYAKMSSVGPLWQVVGPFDNLSGSGFDKDYGALKHPEPGAVFKSVNNADITWFTPSAMSSDGWVFMYPHLQYSTAVAYAQTFVTAPEDMKVLLDAGCNGALKIWVNDEPVISERKELITELDYYKNYVQLKKGANRVLVQLSYTGNSIPNFIVRFTDDKFMPVKGLSSNPVYQSYPSAYSAKAAPAPIRLFAETFFEDKIKQQPDNMVNYILLMETYLRDKRTAEARALIEDVLKKYPDNSLLRYELIQCYLKDNNSTLLSQEVERIKQKDPDCKLVSELNIYKLMQQEKYSEADEQLKKYDATFGTDEDDLLKTRVQLYSKQNKMEELIKLIETAYKKHPDDPNAVIYMFNVKTNVNKDVKGALSLYENYLKNNYNYDISKNLIQAYKDHGMADKQLKYLKTLSDGFPSDPDMRTDISSFYFGQQNYAKAAEYGQMALGIAPYVSTYWENLALELKEQHKDEPAIDAFKKALYYSATNYSAREALRDLQKKPSVWKAFPDVDADSLIRKNNENDTVKNYNYYYLLDQKFTVVYPEGTSEEYFTYIIKIVNEKGIDNWKESSIPYNSNSSYLVIEKAEVVKKDGTKTEADVDDNQIVFKGLEAGDAVVMKYKLQNYPSGRLAHEYWNKFNFQDFVPEKLSRFCLLAADNIKFNFKTLNAANLKPTITPYDNNFKLYTWQMQNTEAAKDENYMPPLGDISPSVMVSTVPSWGTISGWYSDLSMQRPDDDFELKHAFNQLFPKGTSGISQTTVADSIYAYIERNIRYSSVSFRQSSYTPQKPAVTINTGLGDCKDLSTLFVALGNMAGITSNLVLVNTRDNGQATMPLPSVEFNHCIVKTTLDGKPYFLELTDNTLPFRSTPSGLYNAASLLIPLNASDTSSAKLEYIQAANKTPDRIVRKADIVINGSDLNINTTITKTGVLTSSLRDNYRFISKDEQKENLEKSISQKYKNAVSLQSCAFDDLDKMDDSITYSCQYTVKDEISEVGSIKMLKLNFEDVVATLDNFSKVERHFPVEYYRYEDVDDYITNINVTAPSGTKFKDIPKDASYTFGGSTYSLQYKLKDARHLQINRKADLKKDDVAPAQYTDMKTFLNNIVKAESKYISLESE